MPLANDGRRANRKVDGQGKSIDMHQQQARLPFTCQLDRKIQGPIATWDEVGGT